MTKVVFALAVALVLGYAPGTHATLIDNGGSLVYDMEQHITWDDSAPMPMNWSPATSWATALTDGGTTAGAWSLPTEPGTDWGSPSEAETRHLSYDEPAYAPDRHREDTGHSTPDWFWTGKEYESFHDRDWDFGTGGFRDHHDRDRYYSQERHHHYHHEGATTPMPTAALLFGPCFMGLAVIRRMFKK